MSYFDPREENIEIELTEYGVEKISEGDFNPEYYSFHDDGILYDAEYASVTESQNAIQGRILDETPRLKPTMPSSASAHLRKDRDQVETPFSYQEQIIDSSLGTVNTQRRHDPYFRLSIFGDIQISSSARHKDENINRIPQIDLEDVEYEVEVTDFERINFDEVEDSDVTKDGVNIKIESLDVLVDLEEIGSQFEDDNFEVEVFEVEDKGKHEKLKPLYFTKNEVRSRNKGFEEILTEKGENVDIPQEFLEDFELVRDHVDIKFDEEIPKDVLCRYLRNDSKQGIFGFDFDCGDIDEDGAISTKDLYKSSVDRADIDKEC